MKNLILISVLATGFATHAKVSKPRNPNTNRPPQVQVGIGKFMQNQTMVIRLMDHLGWPEGYEYEETGLEMKDLMIKMVEKDPEMREWVQTANDIFESEKFTLLPKSEQKAVIFEGQIYVKLSIQAMGLLQTAPKTKLDE